ncbi:G-protein coupled receptor mth2 [Plakobranchus ocellatus]|uniref:G-protein coupled receptor mth2 n=1 Tax=Plakobranchus ocellatus TaxID=259542 RepID=A0AAV4D287_9GAST|nr:G-protein coupled receptor mth2 [Plakobranchus ocellatus]
MFRVFTAKTRNTCTDKSQSKVFAWSVVLSCLFPTAIVCTVMGVSHLTSGGRRTGYGHESCYLDSSLLKGLTTALPLGLISIANLVFFGITVIKIHNVKKLQTLDAVKKEDRKNLFIYIKLSTMTGSFWLMQILAEAVNSETLRFVAIITNGLQGTFIFLSYICNKRVLNLCLQKTRLQANLLDHVRESPRNCRHHRRCPHCASYEIQQPRLTEYNLIDRKGKTHLKKKNSEAIFFKICKYDRKSDARWSRSSGVHSGQGEGCAIDEDVHSDSGGQNGDCDKSIKREENWLESNAFIESEDTKENNTWVQSEIQQRQICEFVENGEHFLEHEDDTIKK